MSEEFDYVPITIARSVEGDAMVVMSTYYGRPSMSDDAVVLTHDVHEAAGM